MALVQAVAVLPGTNCAPDQKPAFVSMLEYEQGNASKLVRTPLTDKCYFTFIHKMHLGYGGNPCGPIGTKKTESVKASVRASDDKSSFSIAREL